MNTLSIARFSSATDNRPQVAALTWPELAAELTAPHKPLAVPGLAKLTPGSNEWAGALDRAKKSAGCFSPVSYAPGATRGKAGVLEVFAYVADLDHVSASDLAELRSRWQGLAWVMYSSVKHRAESPRVRVVFPLAAPVSASDWGRVWAKLTYHLTNNQADPAAKDASRLYFLPIAPPELQPEAISDRGEGDLLDPARYEEPPAFESAARMVENLQKRDRSTTRASEGKGKPGEDYNESASVSLILELLQRHGGQVHSEHSSAVYVTRPGKDIRAGLSGVIGWPGDPSPIFYCFTSSWPGLEVRAYDPFGLYAALEHGSDFAAAASALAKMGYGDPFPEVQTVMMKMREGKDPLPGPAPKPKKKDQEEEQYHLTDFGNARRLVARHGGAMRFSPALGWLAWDGQRWQRDESGQIERWAKETVLSIYLESAEVSKAASKETDDEKRDKLQKRAAALIAHAKKSEEAGKLAAMVSVARSEPGVYVAVKDLDASPWLLNCQNGTLDLRTGKLLEHRREDLLTKIVPVAYDPKATCPAWGKFLERVLPDAEVRSYVQRATGYSLTGSVGEQCLFFFYGEGANGKSTFLHAIRCLMGDYGQQASSDLLVAKPGVQIPNDVAALRGARFVATIEVEDGKRMAEGLMKQLTGGDTISARFMRGEFFQFEPTFKIFLAANHRPQMASGDDFATWRRIKVIPFTERITEEEKDPELGDKLQRELPGVLAWAVRGCLDWRKSGMQEPAAVRASIEAYRSSADLLGRFIEDACVLHPTAKAKAGQLYHAYAKWCEENGHRAMSSTKFGEHVTKRGGIEKTKTGGLIQYFGIGLCHAEGNPEDMGPLGETERVGRVEAKSDITSLESSSRGVISDNSPYSPYPPVVSGWPQPSALARDLVATGDPEAVQLHHDYAALSSQITVATLTGDKIRDAQVIVGKLERRALKQMRSASPVAAPVGEPDCSDLEDPFADEDDTP